MEGTMAKFYLYVRERRRVMEVRAGIAVMRILCKASGWPAWNSHSASQQLGL